MSHDLEYDDNMVRMLELIWGKGYMAPGGPGNVAKLLQGTEPLGKRILDIGCGTGGPALEMARSHGADVVGIDLEAPLVERARASARVADLQDKCTFELVAPGQLSFADGSFDIVVSSGAITQTQDKASLFAECHRVLRPGGYFRCYEWMSSGQEQSEDMRYWLRLEGLTYEFETLEAFGEQIEGAGFGAIRLDDASDWYRLESRREYERIRGDIYPAMVNLLGQDVADHFVENWRMLVIVCESGELRQGYCYAQRDA